MSKSELPYYVVLPRDAWQHIYVTCMFQCVTCNRVDCESRDVRSTATCSGWKEVATFEQDVQQIDEAQ